jgi:hypothetical protein
MHAYASKPKLSKSTSHSVKHICRRAFGYCIAKRLIPLDDAGRGKQPFARSPVYQPVGLSSCLTYSKLDTRSELPRKRLSVKSDHAEPLNLSHVFSCQNLVINRAHALVLSTNPSETKLKLRISTGIASLRSHISDCSMVVRGWLAAAGR